MANEKRLIDANEFWNRLQNVVYDIFTAHEKDGKLTGTASVGYYTETIREVLKQTKTVDAVEVVHGRWELYEALANPYALCSNCGCGLNKIDALNFAYCPYCGAKMDGGNGDG